MKKLLGVLAALALTVGPMATAAHARPQTLVFKVERFQISNSSSTPTTTSTTIKR